MRMNDADRELDQPKPFIEMKIISIYAVGMENSVMLVAGLGEHSVAEEVWRATAGSTLVRHDLSRLADGIVHRWIDGLLTELRLEHGCVSCTMRLDLIPLLRTLPGPVVVHLDPALEPEAVCLALEGEPVRVDAVVTVVDRATWLADATGHDSLAGRGLSAAPGDRRTVSQLVVGQAEFADALVLTGPSGDDRIEAVLDRLNPSAPRQEVAHLHVPTLLAAIDRDARRGEVDDLFSPLLRGRPPLEAAHGVHLTHFTARRPFHPARLHRTLVALAQGVVRIRGRVWLASRHDTALWLEAAGRAMRMADAGPWLTTAGTSPDTDARHADLTVGQELHPGDREQELVIIAHRSSSEVITSALREALITDEEAALAGELRFADPFPGAHEKQS